MSKLSNSINITKEGFQLKSVVLVPFDERCLNLSWYWLNDPEIKELTMTPIFTRNDQDAFFKALPMRKDYIIWGIALNSTEIIGAAGLKNHRGNLAEYWGYIGERKYWGKGLGRSLIAEVETKARELGFSALDLKVSSFNKRAIALYKRAGFVVDVNESTFLSLRMYKQGI